MALNNPNLNNITSSNSNSQSHNDVNNNQVNQENNGHKKYRNILPEAKEAQGRSILQIIYDRSIRGPKGIDSKYRINNHVAMIMMAENNLDRHLFSLKDNLMRRDSNLSNASPSSVIISDENRGDDHRDDDHDLEEDMMGQNEEEGEDTDMSLEPHHYNSNSGSGTNTCSNCNSHEQDSLSEILNSDEQTEIETANANASISASTMGFSRANDSLSEILNCTNQNQPPTTKNNQSISNSKMTPPLPPPSRLKMNSYPSCHFTEIKNYCELYTVTKFNSNYLCLKTREESNNYNHRHNHNDHPRRRHPNHHNDDSNNNNDDDDSNSSSSSNNTAISTISIAFSPDGRTVASTHGDHSVKITCCHTGALIRNLEGHPRTPWTVKYHPTKSNIVASGCLGFQVRVWDWNYGSSSSSSSSESNHECNHECNYHYHQRKGVCLNMIRLQSAIISLSFHPTGSLLAVASGHSLHLWVYDDGAKKEYEIQQQQQEQQQVNNQMAIENNNEHNVNQNHQSGNTSSGDANDQQLRQQQPHNINGNPTNGTVPNNGSSSSAIITQIRYEHTLRCVHFPPGGDTIILGGVNPPQGREASYSLRLWDFDLEVALNPQKFLGREGERVAYTNDDKDKEHSVKRRDALTNFRTFVPRALLYNDGGFDVSPDGNMLCGCAEIFLPDGVDSAMEIIEKTTWKYNGDDDDDINIRSSLTNNTNSNDAMNDNNNKEATNNNVRSPRRKMNRPHGDKKEKRRKELTGGRVIEENNEENNDEVSSPSERPSVMGAAGCRTPPNPVRPQVLTSPPSPPGRRWSLNFNRQIRMPIINNGVPGGLRLNPSQNQVSHSNADGPIPPPLHTHQRSGIRLGLPPGHKDGGRFVPHVVVVNLDRKSGKLGQLLEATPLGSRASSVTCVKFSPSAEFCLLGYGVREHASQQHHGQQYHPVTALYRVRGGLSHIATMNSTDDDVNIARFHPHSGQGFVYGTKQGRVRVLSPRPWNQYYEY